jgi:hypothetical protein
MSRRGSPPPPQRCNVRSETSTHLHGLTVMGYRHGALLFSKHCTCSLHIEERFEKSRFSRGLLDLTWRTALSQDAMRTLNLTAPYLTHQLQSLCCAENHTVENFGQFLQVQKRSIRGSLQCNWFELPKQMSPSVSKWWDSFVVKRRELSNIQASMASETDASSLFWNSWPLR